MTRRSSFGRSSFVGLAAALVLSLAIPGAASADVWTDAKHGTVDSNTTMKGKIDIGGQATGTFTGKKQ